MKTELRLRPHSQLVGASVYELWYAGAFIGEVTGADGPGVRVLSKHALGWHHTPGAVQVIEVQMHMQDDDAGTRR